MPDSSDIEQRLARKYRQPRRVEQFGVEVIPGHLRTVRWWDIFSIVLNFVVNPGTIVISGALIAAGMSLWQAVLTGFLSILIGFSTYLVAATVGVDYGVPGLVSMRSAFGIRGAWVTSVLRAVSSVYWFAFQTVSGAAGIVAVLRALFGVNVGIIPVSAAFAVLQLLVAMFGYNSLRLLSRASFVVKIAFSVVLMIVLMTFPQQSFRPDAVISFAGTPGGKVALVALWSISMATAWFSNFTDAADFCRYSKTRVDMWVGTFLAAVLGQLICSFLGGYAVAAVGGRSDNAFDVIVMSCQGSVVLLVFVFVYILLDNWIINVQNLYTAGLALSSILSRLGRFWGTLLVGLVGVALSLNQGLVSGYTGYMNQLGNLFAPLAGVFVAHYVLLSRGRIDVPALFERGTRYWYWRGVNWLALGWVAVGYGVNSVLPQQYLNILVAAVVSGGGYALSARLLRPRSAPLAAALDVVPTTAPSVPSAGSPASR